jgi:hypothetical protein
MRDAVFTLLSTDTQLQTLGGTGFVVVPNFAGDQRPNDAGAFIVITWGITDFKQAIQANGPHHFDVYANIPVALSTDFVRIDAILDRCDDIFGAVEDGDPVVGGDGYQLEYVGFQGRSLDMTDEGYQSICRSASYYALGSKVTT